MASSISGKHPVEDSSATQGARLLRIGIFYDGNYFFQVSNYYNYVHQIRKRISIDGLHGFIRSYLSKQEGIDERYCRIIEAHYFRGRLSSYEAEQANRLLAERLFEDILISEGVITHYLPLRTVDGRREEKGIDIWLALEAFELTIHKQFDILVLIACDGDYRPLVRKVNSLGTRVMVLGWNFEYTDSRNGRLHTTFTSTDLLAEASYPVAMNTIIEAKEGVEDLFVEKNVEVAEPLPQEADTREESYILGLKEGYGFIARTPNNLFFHWSDVVGADFNDLRVNDRVVYQKAQNDKGQDIAVKVERVN